MGQCGYVHVNRGRCGLALDHPGAHQYASVPRCGAELVFYGDALARSIGHPCQLNDGHEGPHRDEDSDLWDVVFHNHAGLGQTPVDPAPGMGFPPCGLPSGHDGDHSSGPDETVRTGICNARFTDHQGIPRVCDVIAGHIGGHQHLGIVKNTQQEPDPEEVVSPELDVLCQIRDILSDMNRKTTDIRSKLVRQR